MIPQDTHERTSDGRRRILDAAYPLYVEFGYKAVSMQQIADAAQIHKATLYHHFQHKEALFASVVLMAMTESRAEVASVIDRGGTAAEQLVQIATQLFARTQSDFGRLMTDMHENISPEVRNRVLKEQSMPWELFEQIVRAAIEEGELPVVDSGLAVSMFVGLVWGQIWMRKMQWIDGPLDVRLASILVDVLFAGLRSASSAGTDLTFMWERESSHLTSHS